MPMGVFLVLEMSREILCSVMCSLNSKVFTNTGTSDEVADYVIFLDHIIGCNLHVMIIHSLSGSDQKALLNMEFNFKKIGICHSPTLMS
jgi:hypothetical protein